MKKSLYTFQLFVSLLLTFTYTASQNWCIPPVIPYSGTMPGISNVTFNTIDHDSPTLESSTSNYINTGISTTVVRGQTYNFSMTYNVDDPICPDMNLRVWIDFNLNDKLDDAGEQVITEHDQFPGTYNGQISIPANATLGTTRMRVVSKMTSKGGHILPSPCDIPADPVGFHGGVEDYDLIITAATGIQVDEPGSTNMSIYPDPLSPVSMVHFHLTEAQFVRIDIFSISGEKVMNLTETMMHAGNSSISLAQVATEMKPGLYFMRMIHGSSQVTRRFLVLK